MRSLADTFGDWRRRCLSRCGTAADARIVERADAAVQRRGQAASASPPASYVRWQMHAGTGAAGACPGVGPRRMQALLNKLTPRSNDEDRQQVPVPPLHTFVGRCTLGLAPQVPVPFGP